MSSMLPSKETVLRRFAVYRTVCAALVAVAVVLRTVNLFLFYESDIGYYPTGAVLPTVFRIFLLLCTVFFAVSAFVLAKPEDAPLPKTNRTTLIVALIVAVSLSIAALWRYCLGATPMATSTIVVFVAGGLAAVYFILFAFGKLSAPASLLTGFGAILWFACVIGASYFDMAVPMNAPFKLIIQLACAGGMLLMLAEMRLACHAIKRRFILFALPAATLYLLSSAIPSLIADAARVTEGRTETYADVACLALGLFALTRLLSPFAFAEDETAIAEEASAEEASAEHEVTTDSEPQESESTDATE